MVRRLHDYPFLDYAAKNWGSEADALKPKHVLSLVRKFASNPTAVEVVNQARSVKNEYYAYRSQSFPRNVPILALAASFNLPNILKALIDYGHELDGKGSDGETALMKAAILGYEDNVAVLLQEGATVDLRDHMDETALFKAAKNGRTESLILLLRHGADVALKDSKRHNAAHVRRFKRQSQCCRVTCFPWRQNS